MEMRDGQSPILLDSKDGKAWQLRCEKVADTLDVGVIFFEDGRGTTDAFEDDGALHVMKHGLHACFGVDPSQDNGELSNNNSRAILTALNMKRHITERVIVEEYDEDEDDDETCSHCGHFL